MLPTDWDFWSLCINIMQISKVGYTKIACKFGEASISIRKIKRIDIILLNKSTMSGSDINYPVIL